MKCFVAAWTLLCVLAGANGLGRATEPPTCHNGRFDDGETAPDCGGICFTPCPEDRGCRQDADCATHKCVSGVCGSASGAMSVAAATSDPPADPPDGSSATSCSDEEALQQIVITPADKPVWTGRAGTVPPRRNGTKSAKYKTSGRVVRYCSNDEYLVVCQSPDNFGKKPPAVQFANQDDLDGERNSILNGGKRWRRGSGCQVIEGYAAAYCIEAERFCPPPPPAAPPPPPCPWDQKLTVGPACDRLRPVAAPAAPPLPPLPPAPARCPLKPEIPADSEECRKLTEEIKEGMKPAETPAGYDRFHWVALRAGVAGTWTRSGVAGNIQLQLAFPVAPRWELALGGGAGISPTRGWNFGAHMAINRQVWASEARTVAIALGLATAVDVDAGDKFLYRSINLGPGGILSLRLWRFHVDLLGGWAVHVRKPLAGTDTPRVGFDGWWAIAQLTVQFFEK